ncbi:hypothetical protein CAAN1_06S05358 [[Candida] anglica]|uniref:Large ribosomal subunit protein mL50 n=1 Tax=[Candida] anglica TaxID=148631 RepID=A0ABP0EMB3_9ASCO
MLSPITRQLGLTASRSNIRLFSYTSTRPFITDLFRDRKTLEQRNDQLAEKNAVEASSPEEDVYKKDSKIVFLTKENSPDFKHFNMETDMPGFKIEQWKSQIVKKQDIEAKYSPELLKDVITQSYTEVSGAAQVADFASVELNDLQLRFNLAKSLQQKLGFDISDYIFSKSHNLELLHSQLSELVSIRYTNERNPNAIALRPEDFTAGNVYLNEELNSQQQEKAFAKLVQEAKKAEASA